jgi:hypothetical protein
MEQRRFQADGRDYRALRRGWCVGGEEFRQELLAQAKVRVGPNHFGSERRESAEERARRIIGEAMKKYALSKEKLESLPAGSGIKVELARRLRRETTMSLKRIAGELGIGSWKYLSNLLSRSANASARPELGL